MTKYVCDLCGKETTEKREIDMKFPGDINYTSHYDVCNDCLWAIKDVLDHKERGGSLYDKLKALWRRK